MLTTRMLLTVAVSAWACVYTGSVAWALWRQQQFRGAVGMAILALVVLVMPPLTFMINQME